MKSNLRNDRGAIGARHVPPLFPGQIDRDPLVGRDRRGAAGKLLARQEPAGETFAALNQWIEDARFGLASVRAEEVDSFVGRPMRFVTQDHHADFTADDFLLTFLVENSYFHAATTYGILRHLGLPIGKADYRGPLPLVKTVAD